MKELQLDSLINALQLCIKTPVTGYRAGADNALSLVFVDPVPPVDDKGLKYFQKLVDGEWDQDKIRLTIKNARAFLSAKVVNFLMLSRLQEENMKALAKLDPQYRTFTQKILGNYQESLEEKIESIQQASKIVFSNVEKQKMTLRELAHRSGLTQVALSNFKAGKDIRLSSLLKILKALGLNLRI